MELEYINLESNLFEQFPFKAFEEKTQKSLKKIDLSRNRIAKMEYEKDKLYFQNFKELRWIDLSSNKLTEFPVQLLAAPKLKILRLIKNEIKSIPEEVYRFHDTIS